MIAETKEDKLLLARLADKQSRCEQRQYPVCSDFLDPRQQALAAEYFSRRCACGFWGGFAEAERRVLVFLPDYLTLEDFVEPGDSGEDQPLAVLRAVPTDKQNRLTHRDYLGALLALGVSRGRLGDILVRNDLPSQSLADIVILREAADFLLLNFQRAGRCALQLELLPCDVLRGSAPRTESRRCNVSSLRLDSVAAAAFGLSRSKASAAVAVGLVAVDGLTVLKGDHLLAEGAKITWQGRGKVRLAEVGSKTRKERIWVQIEKYI